MRRPRDAEATRTAVLEAATALFAAKGFAGVSVDQVAKAAGVQRSLLLYHFGTKLNLWAAVAESRLGRYLAHLEDEVERLPDDGFLPALASGHFRFLQENPDLVRLTTWHKLEGVFAELSSGAGANAPGARVLGRLHARIRALQKAGRVRTDVEPRNLVAAVLGLVEYWFQSEEMLTSLGGAAGRKRADRYLADALRLLERGAESR